MKNFAIVALACLALSGCKEKNAGFEIEGNVEGAENGLVYLQAFRNKMFYTVDSTEMKDGKFTFKGSVDIPALYGITTAEMGYPAQLFVENGELEVELSADGQVLKVENSPVAALFQANKEKVFDENYNIDSLVTANPTSSVAAFFLYRYFTYRMPLEQLKATRAKLSADLNTSPYVAELDRIIAILEKVQLGAVAPEFTLPDTAGVNVSLSSFRGQYVLLDFWASWCPPCRKENPNVVAAFNQYKDKNFTVIGVSLDKDKGAWMSAIAKDSLTWTHLSDLSYWDSKIPALYGVRAIPSNVLIDPEGIIIGKDLREEALQAKLEEVLNLAK